MGRVLREWGLLFACACLAAACGDRVDDAWPAGGPPGPPRPAFGDTALADPPPPPISGGTLLATADGRWLVAADPDRDRVYVVERAARRLAATVPLSPRDEPGRLVEDGAGRVHVALRGGGAVADIDVAAGRLLDRRAVCGAPRGLAWDRAADALHVACGGGELVTLPAAGGAPTRTLRLDEGLRDVLIGDDGALLVSRFRQAELLRVDAGGKVASRDRPGQGSCVPCDGGQLFIDAALAFRTRALVGGTPAMLHQTGDSFVGSSQGSYGSSRRAGCDGIVQAAYSELGAGKRTAFLGLATLPVDFAVDGDAIAVVAAGNAHMAGVAQVMIYSRAELFDAADGFGRCVLPGARFSPSGEVTAVLFSGGDLVAQSREPAALQFRSDGLVVPLSGERRAHTGHAVFHSDSGAGLACASCHGEGGDDGRVWNFSGIGPRRTQSLRGGVIGAGPFHWSGDEPDLGRLVDDVFVGRMNGPRLSGEQVAALGAWVNALPALPVPAPADPEAVARGAVLFNDPLVGCATCHVGGGGTTRELVDVGTGSRFKVPALAGSWSRAPFLHNGCATTLVARFDPACGGDDRHGHTSQLTGEQQADLAAYVESR